MNQGILALINTLFLEIYGDRIQCMHLIHCYFRNTILMQQQYMKELDMLIKSYAIIDMLSKINNDMLMNCDMLFKQAIEVTYKDYVVIGSLIISRVRIDTMVDVYTNSMQSH